METSLERKILIFVYIAICILDFAIAPWAWVLVQSNNDIIYQWQPVTTNGSGLFHIGFIILTALTKTETISSMFKDFWDKLSAAQATIVVALISAAFTSPIILEIIKPMIGKN